MPATAVPAIVVVASTMPAAAVVSAPTVISGRGACGHSAEQQRHDRHRAGYRPHGNPRDCRHSLDEGAGAGDTSAVIMAGKTPEHPGEFPPPFGGHASPCVHTLCTLI